MKQKITLITIIYALSLFLIGLLLTGISPQEALAQTEHPGESTPQACALLDDAQARGLMSGAFETKLMFQCGLLSLPERQPYELLEQIFGPTQTDILVNDPTTDLGSSTTQSETSIAINPDTGTICSAYNDSQHWANGSIAFAGFSSSSDDGATFVDHGPFPIGGGGSAFGDPSLVWRRSDGKFYYASLHSNGLGLWRSDDDCESMVYNSMIHTGPGDDKEMMAVDNNPASPYYGRLYVAWTDFNAGAQIYVTYSDDTTTWSIPVAVSAVGVDVQGAWPAIDPVTNDVYVAWVRWNPYYTGPIDIEVVRSTNGGTSFTAVTNPLTGAVNPYDNTAAATCGRPALNADIRYLPSPQIVVGPDSALHVVYSYDPDGNGTGDVINVYYRRSTDYGASWGPEIRLNDDATQTDQWFPTISVNPTNVIVATWYDRRLDVASNFMFDYYKVLSLDGGLNWGANIRVSDVSSSVPTLAPNFDPIVATCYHGDYDQQVQYNDYVYIQWSDDRNIQNAHPDPDIWFEKELVYPEIGWLEGTVYNANTMVPIAGASIDAVSGFSFHTMSGSDGSYSMIAVPDTYDVTGSAFGYQPNTITGVTIISGTTTTQDIALTPATHYTVEGVVTDAATGWPLYASIDTHSPAGVFWTDPETGYYSISLPEGIAYNFEVAAWVLGYIPVTRVVGPLTADATENFALDANPATCIAPGYQKTYAFFDDFESGYYNWTGSGLWNPEAEGDTCGSFIAPFPSPSNAVYYGQDGVCTYDTGAATSGDLTLISPVTLPNFGGALEFASYEETECGGDCGWDNRYVEISNDGGTTWNTLGKGDTEGSWYLKSFDLSAYGSDNVLVRFRFDSVDSIGNSFFGWMVDDVGFIDNCVPPLSGGLVVGNVYNQNTLDPVIGAEVSNDTGEVTLTLPTPDDPNIDDAFYTLFSPDGDHSFTATHVPPYGPAVETVTVLDGDAVRQDFFLPAPSIAFEPEILEAWLITNTAVLTHSTGLDIINNGGVNLGFEIVESDGGYLPPVLTSPSAAPVYSEPAPIGPASVRSVEGQRLLAKQINAPNAWSAGATMPAGDGVVRYGKAQCKGDLGSFYVIGGVDESFSITAKVWRYDATTDTWNPLADIPNPQEGVTAVCYGGYIYVLNGGGTNYFSIYHIALDTWSAGPAFPRNVWGAAAGAYDGKVFFIGGDNDFTLGGVSNQVDIYDIDTGTWSTGTAMPTATSTPLNAQAGRYLYIVGGWGDTSPTNNVNATQRYDMSTDTWEIGPTFSSARADGSLVITEEYLYAIGGDADGGGAFDASAIVETLDWTAWPGGTWIDIGDPLPTAVSANTGGFCTDALSIGEVWNVGGYTGAAIIGNTDYRVSEHCFLADIPWLWEDPTLGVVPTESDFPVEIMFTALYPDMVTPMPFGTYTATLLVYNNDPIADTQPVPVRMHIVDAFSDPVASFTSNSPVTLGDIVVFTNTSTEGLPPTEYYLWDFGDGQTLQVSNTNPINHDYALPGVYTVTLTAHQAQTGVEDVYSDTVVVTGYLYLPLITKDY